MNLTLYLEIIILAILQVRIIIKMVKDVFLFPGDLKTLDISDHACIAHGVETHIQRVTRTSELRTKTWREREREKG